MSLDLKKGSVTMNHTHAPEILEFVGYNGKKATFEILYKGAFICTSIV
ncbi:MAG: hypothetical protein LBC82_03545 [Oscillospiraceae bacterium]|jgi:hypothetical protein|nr:hypothetical protein [Oscillospiraceae bacterium]